MLKVPFGKTCITTLAVKWRIMDIQPNRGPAGTHYLRIHSCKEYLLNTSTVISKTGFELKAMLHQDYQSFGSKILSRYLGHRYTLYYMMQVFVGNFQRYDTF